MEVGSQPVVKTTTTREPAERTDDPVRMYLSDVYTVTANLVGIPGISLPAAPVNGLPVGLQLMGRSLDEATLLRVADAFQRRTDHHEQRPELP